MLIFGFQVCFRVCRGLGNGGVLVYQDWLLGVGVLRVLPGIPLLGAVDLLGARAFWGFRGGVGVWRCIG